MKQEVLNGKYIQEKAQELSNGIIAELIEKEAPLIISIVGLAAATNKLLGHYIEDNPDSKTIARNLMKSVSETNKKYIEITWKEKYGEDFNWD